jgi:hypothetical protein
VIVIATLLVAIAAAASWGLVRARRARRAVRLALQERGWRVLQLERRVLRQGPLFWTSTPSQFVFRALVSRDDDGHAPRTAWARWGRTWLPGPDRLEIRW